MSAGNSYHQIAATKTFRWSPKTEITAIKLWRYDFPARHFDANSNQPRE
jgi:hypothetical protein